MLTALMLAAALSPFDEVVAAERAFAAASTTKGLHEAFLDNLAADAISFEPLPSPARLAHENQPPSKGRLTWAPSWVAVNPGGDMALSTGPWQFLAPENPVLKHETTGWFVSVWRKQPNGRWKVAVDAGVAAAMPYQVPQTVQNGFPQAPPQAAAPKVGAGARSAIDAAEHTFAAAARSGIGGAVHAQADPLIRVYRENKGAADGIDGARPFLSADQRKGTCATEKVVISAAGDMGYTYGACEAIGTPQPAKYAFLHVWRKQPDGSWRLVVDVTP
jgi:ketosteroid isomerase-like protein